MTEKEEIETDDDDDDDEDNEDNEDDGDDEDRRGEILLPPMSLLISLKQTKCLNSLMEIFGSSWSSEL